MSNYLIKDVNGPKDGKPYPNSEGKEFLSGEEYMLAARKIIRKFGCRHPFNLPKYRVDQILSGDDFAVELANAMVLADLTYDEKKSKGKKPYAWRNYRALRAFQECIKADRNKKNKKFKSLSDPYTSSPLTYSSNEKCQAHQIVGEADRKERIRIWARFLVENSGLSEGQRNCIELRYFGGPWGMGIDNLTKIGNLGNPPSSRQDVIQKIDLALNKMKMTAIGSVDLKRD